MSIDVTDRATTAAPAAVVIPVALVAAPAPIVVATAARPVSPGARLTAGGAALCILGALLLGFALDLTVVGGLHHSRDQQTGYAELRKQLANGTAPVGQTDSNGVLLAPGVPVALLEIPAVGLREVVLEGTTSRVLMSGAGHRRDSVLPGQAGTSVVLGRKAAFGGPFRDLAALRVGQTLVATTGQGRSTFTVVAVRRAGDPLPPPLAAGQGRLSLVTASGPSFLPDGVVRVDADVTSPPLPAPPRAFGAGALAPAERVLAGDTSGLVILILWAQALLLAADSVTWARFRWGRAQAWVVGVPVLAAVGVAVADQVARLLPNLL